MNDSDASPHQENFARKRDVMEPPTSIHHSDSENRGSAPFFSIGITTYNRPDLLKQTLDSISAQTFADFEAIVGNDYAEEPLSAELLGITDRSRSQSKLRTWRELSQHTGRYPGE